MKIIWPGLFWLDQIADFLIVKLTVFGTEKWLQIKVNFTIRKSAILIQSKKHWAYDFNLSHFICTTINILEFMIGSSLFNYLFEIIIPMTGELQLWWKISIRHKQNTKALTDNFLQGNISLRHLLNTNDLFISLLTEIYLQWNERLGPLAPALFSAHSRKKNLAIIVLVDIGKTSKLVSDDAIPLFFHLRLPYITHKTYFISDTKEGLLDHRLDTTFFAFFFHICCPSEDFSEKFSFTKIFLYV